MAPSIPQTQSKLVLPRGSGKVISASSRMEEQQQALYEAAQVMKGAHIHALATAYLEETGLKAEETMLVEETSRDGLGKRYFFLRKPEAPPKPTESVQKSPDPTPVPSSGQIPTPKGILRADDVSTENKATA